MSRWRLLYQNSTVLTSYHQHLGGKIEEQCDQQQPVIDGKGTMGDALGGNAEADSKHSKDSESAASTYDGRSVGRKAADCLHSRSPFLTMQWEKGNDILASTYGGISPKAARCDGSTKCDMSGAGCKYRRGIAGRAGRVCGKLSI